MVGDVDHVRIIVKIRNCGVTSVYGVGKIVSHIRGASYDVVDGQKVVGNVYSVADNGVARNIRKLIRNVIKIGIIINNIKCICSIKYISSDISIIKCCGVYICIINGISNIYDIGATRAATTAICYTNYKIPLRFPISPNHVIGR